MRQILLAAGPRIQPLIAIGGYAGIRSAETTRPDWKNIRWDRGPIEIAGSKAKAVARRPASLPENLKAWLAPWRHASGRIVSVADYSGPLNDLGIKAGIPGG